MTVLSRSSHHFHYSNARRYRMNDWRVAASRRPWEIDVAPIVALKWVT